jgi:phosphoribosylanthranilate isomerase
VKGTTHPRVKICCIRSTEEARLAIDHGAAAVGLVSRMPSGPGVIAEPVIAEIAAVVPPGVSSFLLTSHQSSAAIVEQQRRLRTSAIQICDDLLEGTHADLRAALPGIALVQVIHVTGEDAVAKARAIAPSVDAILLDSGNQRLAIRELGGTGRPHDWKISSRIREELDVPVFLAGGLREDNVAAAIATVGPFALDVCSGVRTDGRLDPVKLGRFFAAVRGAVEPLADDKVRAGPGSPDQPRPLQLNGT